MRNLPQCIRLLVENGANIDATHEEDPHTTALFVACDELTEAVVDVLSRLGADVNRRHELGDTPLMRAIYSVGDASRRHHGHKWRRRRVVESLVNARANVHESDLNGITVLQFATKWRLMSIVEILVRAGAASDELARYTGRTIAMLDEQHQIADIIENATTIRSRELWRKIAEWRIRVNIVDFWARCAYERIEDGKRVGEKRDCEDFERAYRVF